MAMTLAKSNDARAARKLKNTEIGPIPEDWSVVALGDIGLLKNGINKESGAFGHGSPFVNLMDVFGVSTIRSTDGLGLIDSTTAEQSSYGLRAGDVLFVRSSVKPSGVALTTTIVSDLPNTVFSGFLIRFRDNGELENSFKRHCFSAAYFRRLAIAASSVSANTNISQSALKSLKLALPATSDEQQAIAEVLSDTDLLIDQLECLIAKKSAIKQSAVHDLLSNRKRLPGFVGEWRSVELGQLGPWVGGGTPAMNRADFWTNGTIPWVSSADIRSGTMSENLRYITPTAVAESSARVVPAGSVIMVMRSGILRRFLPVCAAPTSIAINQDLKALIPRSPAVGTFVLHSIIYHGEDILGTCMKTGTTVESVELSWLKKFEILVPPTDDEMDAVSRLLNDLDQEIAQVEVKLAKVRLLKQSMMQELLTGRVRLV